MKKSNINVVWNFFWVQAGKVPRYVDITFRTRKARRYLRRKR